MANTAALTYYTRVNRTSFRLISAIIAVAAYLALAVYLYRWYFEGLSRIKLQDFFVFNVTLAALGTYIFSRRWVNSITASVVAGSVYGFGPFMLGFAGFHPSAGLTAAMVPWLLCVPSILAKGKRQWMAWPLAGLAFGLIVAFFALSAKVGLYAVPVSRSLTFRDLLGLVQPVTIFKSRLISIGVYHVTLAPLFMGLVMFCFARRWWLLFIAAAAAVLAFCPGIGPVSPLAWFTITSVCLAVLIAAGIEGLIESGPSDRKWLLVCFIAMLALTIIAMVLTGRFDAIFAGLGKEFAGVTLYSAKMFTLAAIITGTLYALSLARLHLHWFRLAIVVAACALDIFFGARFIVDTVF